MVKLIAHSRMKTVEGMRDQLVLSVRQATVERVLLLGSMTQEKSFQAVRLIKNAGNLGLFEYDE